MCQQRHCVGIGTFKLFLLKPEMTIEMSHAPWTIDVDTFE